MCFAENLGYYDDGEEHLGVGESKYDGKIDVDNCDKCLPIASSQEEERKTRCRGKFVWQIPEEVQTP